MYNFTFNIPTKIHFGKDTISSLSELKAYGSKVLLVYGGGSIKKNGLYDTAMKILKDAGLTVFELSGVEPNPKIETVRKGVEICKNEGIDMVLAIGGGSTIDCSKVVAAGAKYDGDAWDLVLDGSKVKAALPIFDVLLFPQPEQRWILLLLSLICLKMKSGEQDRRIWCQLCQY